MANYNELKASIEQQIRSNGNQEITGAVLQAAMLNMVDVLGENTAWGGIISPTSTHAELNTNTLYLASEAGTYANFGGVTVEKDEIAAIYYDGASFTKQTVMKVGQVLANLIGSSQEVLNMLAELAEYLAQDPNLATSLATALANKVNKTGDSMSGYLKAPGFEGTLFGGVYAVYNKNDMTRSRQITYAQVPADQCGNLPHGNNANAIIQISTLDGNFGYQIGFTTLGIFWRRVTDEEFSDDVEWNTLVQ